MITDTHIALRRAALLALLAAFVCGGMGAQAAPRCCTMQACEAATPAAAERCCTSDAAPEAPEPTSNPCGRGLNNCCCQLNLDTVAQITAPRVVSLDDLPLDAGFDHPTETYRIATTLRCIGLPLRVAAPPPPSPITLGVFLC